MPRKRNITPEFDLNALVVEDAAPPVRKSTKSIVDNPMRDHMVSSYNSGTGKALTVPTEADAKTIVSLVRAAADELTAEADADEAAELPRIGARVAVEPQDNGTFVVRFSAVDRKRFSPRKRKGDEVTEDAPVTDEAPENGDYQE